MELLQCKDGSSSVNVLRLSKHISAYPHEYHHEEYGKKPFEGCDG